MWKLWTDCCLTFLNEQLAFNTHNWCTYMITWLSIPITICCDGNSPALKMVFQFRQQVPTKYIGSLKFWKCFLLFYRKQYHINTHMASYLHTTCSLFLGQKYPWETPIVNSWRNNCGHQWDITKHSMLFCFYKRQYGWKKHRNMGMKSCST